MFQRRTLQWGKQHGYGGRNVVRISEFQVKDVVNISDGRKLGNIGDIDIDLHSGKIESVIVGSTGRMFGLFGKDEEIVIPWGNIIKIGTDVILVRIKDHQYLQQQHLQEPKT